VGQGTHHPLSASALSYPMGQGAAKPISGGGQSWGGDSCRGGKAEKCGGGVAYPGVKKRWRQGIKVYIIYYVLKVAIK